MFSHVQDLVFVFVEFNLFSTLLPPLIGSVQELLRRFGGLHAAVTALQAVPSGGS